MWTRPVPCPECFVITDAPLGHVRKFMMEVLVSVLVACPSEVKQNW